METVERTCFHCGEPVSRDLDLSVEFEGRERPVCCAGCQAVALLIRASGLGRYYRFRQDVGRKIDYEMQKARAAWTTVDGRESLWGRVASDGGRDLLLQAEGIRCAACAWLIRSGLENQPGIRSVQVDTATGYTRILWDPARTRLSRIAGTLFDLGYVPHLPLAQAEEEGRRAERRDSLKRLGVAGLGMMQVMMYAVGMYAGDLDGDMSAASRGFLTWVSLVVTLPVLLYSGRVFFAGAWRGLRAGRPGMDLPVALAIGLAFTASCVNFFRGEGEIWFDSVVMFIFFLTLGRHVELVLRHRNLQAGSALARLLPEWAQRITAEGLATVPAFDLVPGDRVRVAPGAAFPCDGRIVAGHTEVDESLLSGESRALLRGRGDGVVAGALNLSQAVDVEVSAVAADTTVSSLGRLLLGARSRRIAVAGLPSWLVPAFTTTVIGIAGATWAWWHTMRPELAFPAALAVLVASCPCALALALPAVQAAASRALLRRGILLTRSDALHRLPQVDTVLLDKTGTLTVGHPEREGFRRNPARADFGEKELLTIAGALESHSAHPVARAFRDVGSATPAVAVTTHPGHGLTGDVAGRSWRIGTAAFVNADIGEPGLVHSESLYPQIAQPDVARFDVVNAGAAESSVVPPADTPPASDADSILWLGDDDGWVGAWTLRDALRPGALRAIGKLRGRGLDVRICSGDAEGPVRAVAEALGIENWRSQCAPEDKVRIINALQQKGRKILMIGDGVNDAPVLAHADVSMTVQGASELANSTADLILTAESLDRVEHAFERSEKAVRLVRQNLAWALVYNVSVLPLAISGALQPWMAAIGMSASSLLVVLNATRMNADTGTDSSADSSIDTSPDSSTPESDERTAVTNPRRATG